VVVREPVMIFLKEDGELSDRLDAPAERVLIVDDEQTILALLESALGEDSFETTAVQSVGEARAKLNGETFDLVITDVVMPGESGIELLRWCREANLGIPFIIMTGQSELEHVVDALNLGAHSFIQKPFPLKDMLNVVNTALSQQRYERMQREFQSHLTKTNALLRQSVIDAEVKHETLFIGALNALAQTIDARDRYTQQHSASVASLSRMLAAEMGKDFEVQNAIETAGALHDIGKIAVPEAVLSKPSGLTDEEYAVMKQHPERADAILRPVPGLEEALPGIRAHHERYDGRGYPDGLKGGAIPALGRILAVCDTWDAMTSDRVYRKAMPVEKGVSILREERNRQFDGEAVEAFLALIERGVVKPSWETQSYQTAAAAS
jgi:putative two-component system response regulator